MPTSKPATKRGTPKKKTRTDKGPSKVDQALAKMVDAFEAALLEGSVDPNGWTAPWHVGGFGMCTNAFTGRRYTGTNALILALFGPPGAVWATYNQWQSVGGQVNRGESGLTILVPMVTKDKADEDQSDGDKDTSSKSKSSLWFKTATVFHHGQQTGWEMPVEDPKINETLDAPQHWLDAVCAAPGTKFSTSGTAAYYRPSADEVVVPPMAAFTSSEKFYSTVFHEFGHWTGHASRLDRDQINVFGSADYAFEELVAELTSALLGARLGVETTMAEHHMQYLANWLQGLRDDPTALRTAASLASAAADYLWAYNPA